MDLSNLFPSQRIEDRRPTFEDPSRPAFNYARPSPFRGGPNTAPPPEGLAQQAGAADLPPLVQQLLAQRAIEMLRLRGQLPSYDWHYNAPLPQGEDNVGQDTRSPVGLRR